MSGAVKFTEKNLDLSNSLFYNSRLLTALVLIGGWVGGEGQRALPHKEM